MIFYFVSHNVLNDTDAQLSGVYKTLIQIPITNFLYFGAYSDKN